MSGTAEQTTTVRPPRTAGTVRRFARRFGRQPIAMSALAVLVVLVTAAVFAPLVARHSPTAQNLLHRNAGPDGTHWFGTDGLGRDLFARMVFGARVTLVAPLIAVGVGVLLGVPLALVAGLRGGWLDAAASRGADAILALPGLIVAMAIVAARGPSTVNAMTAVGFGFAPRLFRLVRGSTLAVRDEPFIDASRLAGASNRRLVVSHVLPNVAPALIVQATILLGVAVLAEAGLSFLGIGVEPPEASWGVLLRTAFDNLSKTGFQAIPPGVAISVLILAFQFIGDGMRDSLGQEVRRG